MGVPGNANALLLKTAAAAGGYQVSRSLRFNAQDSAGLSRSVSAPSSTTTGTFSFWVKRSSIPSSGAYGQTIFGGHSSRNCTIEFDDGGYDKRNSFRIVDESSSPGTYICQLATDQVFRDPSAWYHIVLALDSTQATSTNRIKMYVNGTQVTTFAGAQYYPNQNASFSCLVSSTKYIGSRGAYSDQYFNGYLAEFHFIDGLALAASDFGQTDSTTGQWIPRQYSGSFGSQGWKLNFADNSAATAAALGKDSAGSNNWTPNNFSVTAGAGNDSLKDSPTSISGTDTGVGGEIAGNYCTWNPLNRTANTPITLKNGNLEVEGTGSASYWSPVNGTIGMSSGKWYWEVKGTGTLYCFIGIAAVLPDDGTAERWPGRTATSYGYYNGSGNKYNNNTSASYGASYDTTDVIGVAFDADNGKLWFAKNGTWQASGNPASGTNAAYSSIAAGTYFPCVSNFYTSAVQETNFGQRSWAYTAPSGFKALVDTNLTAPVIAKPSTVMDVKLYTGNGGTQTISGLGFSPDLIWIKSRSAAYDHQLGDTVRGVTNILHSNLTAAESTLNTITGTSSDGFTVSAASFIGTNANGQTFAAWTWDAGTSTVTNTQGSITSSVRANASAGFSIVTYSFGNAPTVGHGLGVAPSLIIAKSRTVGTDWVVYHRSLGKDKALVLNDTGAELSIANYWGSSEPSSTVFGTYGNNTNSNNRGDMVAYCFAPVAGYSSFGSHVGNGSSDGVFVYTGFRPKFVLIKRTNTAEDWVIVDASRSTYNVTNLYLLPSSSGAEGSTALYDFVSNGIKFRGVAQNENGSTYVWAAFAEAPFQYARAR